MRWQLRGWSIDDLRGLPPMTDELVDASMSLLMKTATNAYWASPNLVPLIGLTMVRQSIRHGNSGLSAYGYVLYGLVASAVLFEAERGYRFGELAMEVLDRFGARHLVGKTALVHHGFIRHGVDPMATCGKSVLEGFHEAHAAGDIENAAYCAMAALYTAVVSGEPLPALTERLAPYVDAVRASGHEQTIYGTSVWLQAVDNLTANAVEPELRGEHIDFERRLAELLVSERGNAIPQGVCAAGFLAFLLDDERAERHLGLLFANMRNTPGQAYLMPCLGMYAILLTRKRAARRASPGDRAKLVAITRLLERRAKTNPGDHRPFLDLIAAERAAGAGRLDAAARFLDAAAAAAASGFTYLEGLALERAAALHESRGHAETARHLLGRAVAVWQRYGATARLRLLGHDPTAPHELDSSIDVDTLLDTAAAVSREIEVDGVVAKVLRLAIENAGANRATLLLQRDGKLAVRAAATVSDHGTFDLQMPGPTETAPTGWPARVVDYVARTGADLIVPDASADPRFERDHVHPRAPRPLRAVRAAAPGGRADRRAVPRELARARRVHGPPPHARPHDRRPGGDRHRERRPLRAPARDGHRVQPVRPATVPRAPRTFERGRRAARRRRRRRRHDPVQRPARLHVDLRTPLGGRQLRAAQLVPRGHGPAGAHERRVHRQVHRRRRDGDLRRCCRRRRRGRGRDDRVAAAVQRRP